jgi:hypothetical protein
MRHKTTYLTAVVAVVAVFILPRTCLAQKVYQPNLQQNTSLAEFLRDHLGHPDPLLEKEQPTRYYAAFVDLEDNGTQDAVVYVTGRLWCGSGGCVTFVLAPKGSSYRVVSKILITRPPICVLATKTNGWHDLAVRVQGGGVVRSYEARLPFDGRSYPVSPAMPSAQRLTDNVPGKVVIPLVALTHGGRLLYPLRR